MKDRQTLEEHNNILDELKRKLDKSNNNPSYSLLLSCYWEANYLYEDYEEELPRALEIVDYVKRIADRRWEYEDDDYYNLYYSCLLFEAPHIFESYMLYMEKNRPPEKRFYLPRRKQLKAIVDDLQDLEDGKISFLGLSLPPRVGKSTLCIFFISWVMGKRPNSHNAMGGHSGILARGFYVEVLNLIDTNEYTWREIFPNVLTRGKAVESKNAEDLTINVGNPDRFATLTCRGIDGSWTGAVDVSKDGYLYVDDLIKDRTQSLNPRRMEDTYNEYLNKMVDRKNDGAKELMVGTLWSVLDPLSRLSIAYADDPRYRFRRVPALNEKDESNFDYVINGFSTKYYHDMREKIDHPEWMAKYMQAPYVREGILFERDELRYFDGLIAKNQDGEYKAVCDVAFGGGDSVSMPIALKVDARNIYIIDWIFDNRSPDDTVPLVAGAIMKYGIKRVIFEKNNGGELYAQKVKEFLLNYDYLCACETVTAPVRISKIDKIKAYAPDIKNRFVFIEGGNDDMIPPSDEFEVYKRTAQYQKAMEELHRFVTVGKNDHDDAADSISMLAIDMFGYIDAKSNAVEVAFNPFRH